MLLKQSSGKKWTQKKKKKDTFLTWSHVKLFIDFREWHPWNSINNGWVSNRLPQVPNKNLQHKICQFCSVFFNFVLSFVLQFFSIFFCLFFWPIKNYFCGDTWKSVQFFCLVKCLDPHKWWKLFPTNKDRNVLSHIGMVRPSCELPMIGCYQDHGL